VIKIDFYRKRLSTVHFCLYALYSEKRLVELFFVIMPIIQVKMDENEEENGKLSIDQEITTTAKNHRGLKTCRSSEMENLEKLPKAVVKPIVLEKKNGGQNLISVENDGVDGKIESNEGQSKTSSTSDDQTPPVFDPMDEIYMANACCECMHYRTASVCVGVVELAFMILWLGLALFYHSTSEAGGFAAWLIVCQICLACVFFASIVALFLAVVFEKKFLLLPHMGLQILGIGTGLALTFLAVVVMAIGSEVSEQVFGFVFGRSNLPKIERDFGPIWPFCLAVVFDFGAAIGIWLYVLVKGYYDYLQDKEFFERVTEAAKCAHKICPDSKRIRSDWSKILNAVSGHMDKKF
uniref:MARVEL domain-containing protein n=1 Tax=Romanomermis culicivorax TaxID=13658 RepID=A0A915IVP5_ROMCU